MPSLFVALFLMALVGKVSGESSVASRMAALSRAGLSSSAVRAMFGAVAQDSTVSFENAQVRAMMHAGQVDLTAVGTDGAGNRISVVLRENGRFRQGDVISGMARIAGVTEDDSLVAVLEPSALIERFSAAQVSVRSTGRRKIKVYRIKFDGPTPCGSVESPAACLDLYPMEEIAKNLITGDRSVSNVLKLASFGRYILHGNPDEWETVTVPDGTPFRDLEEMFPAREGEDHVSFFFPPNYFRGIFAGGLTAGVGVMAKQHSWVISNNIEVLAHELGHNLGAQHAGRWDTRDKRLSQYADLSSIMGGGSAYSGMAANQLYSLDWLKLGSEIQHIIEDGSYHIDALYGGSTGVRAAVILQEGWREGLTEGDPAGLAKGASEVWLEWREKSPAGEDRADRDVFFSQRNFDRTERLIPRGPLTGSLLVHTRMERPLLRFPYSFLIGIVEPGSTWTEPNSGLQIIGGSKPGDFTIKGIRTPANAALNSTGSTSN